MPITPQRVHKPMPLRGRRTSWPADSMGDDFAPDCLNVRFRFGEVRGTPGRNILAGPVAAGEKPLWIGQFPQLDGTVWAMMLTTTKLYRWGDASPGTPRQWHEVLPGDTVPTGSSRWTVAVGEGKMFFGRLDDIIYYWTGVSTDPFRSINATAGVQGIGGGALAPRGKYLEYFNNRLIVGFTQEGGNSFANRLRWSESGDFRHWDETLGLGAGFLDLVEGGQEPIRGIKSFGSGSRLFASTRQTLKDIAATGTIPTHVEQLRVRAYGCNAPYTLQSSGQQVFFMGYDRSVYAWDGTTIVHIGEPIFEELHALTDPTLMDTYFAAISTQRQEYWLVLPTGDCFVFDYQRNYWTRDTVPGFTALGEVEDTSHSPSWDEMTTTWNTETHTWDELAGVAMTAMFGGRADGSTSLIDEQVAYDYFSIGSILDRFVETPDFYIDDTFGTKLATMLRFLIVYEFSNPNSFTVGVSFDRGKTWHEQVITPNMQGFNWVEFGGPSTGNTFRFRARENDANGTFRWRSYTYEVIESGDYIGTTTG